MDSYRCGECGVSPDWRVVRLGDSFLTFACFAHLGQVCDSLQRPQEITETLVMNYRKIVEWNAIEEALARVHA